MATLFRGIYEHQLDDKNRLRIPAKFKSGLGESYSFARGMNGCIYVFPAKRRSKRRSKSCPRRDSANRRRLRCCFSARFFPPRKTDRGA